MGTDFFDDDLVRERENALKIKLDGESGGVPRDGNIPSSRDLPNRPVSDLTLTHLARHKQEVADQMVDKAQELDRLRARQPHWSVGRSHHSDAKSAPEPPG